MAFCSLVSMRLLGGGSAEPRWACRRPVLLIPVGVKCPQGFLSPAACGCNWCAGLSCFLFPYFLSLNFCLG